MLKKLDFAQDTQWDEYLRNYISLYVVKNKNMNKIDLFIQNHVTFLYNMFNFLFRLKNLDWLPQNFIN